MPVKPGYRTSEFWLTVITTAWQLLNLSGIWDFVPDSVSLGAATASVTAYTVSRGLAKRAAVTFQPVIAPSSSAPPA